MQEEIQFSRNNDMHQVQPIAYQHTPHRRMQIHRKNLHVQTQQHFKLLQDQSEKHNGGRWPKVSMELGNKTIKDVKTQKQIEMIRPQEDTTL